MTMKFNVGDPVIVDTDVFNYEPLNIPRGRYGVVTEASKPYFSCPYRVIFDSLGDTLLFTEDELKPGTRKFVVDQEVRIVTNKLNDLLPAGFQGSIQEVVWVSDDETSTHPYLVTVPNEEHQSAFFTEDELEAV